jgi:hypothetical protein
LGLAFVESWVVRRRTQKHTRKCYPHLGPVRTLEYSQGLGGKGQAKYAVTYLGEVKTLGLAFVEVLVRRWTRKHTRKYYPHLGPVRTLEYSQGLGEEGQAKHVVTYLGEVKTSGPAFVELLVEYVVAYLGELRISRLALSEM